MPLIYNMVLLAFLLGEVFSAGSRWRLSRFVRRDTGAQKKGFTVWTVLCGNVVLNRSSIVAISVSLIFHSRVGFIVGN